jgi:hypothetical protein
MAFGYIGRLFPRATAFEVLKTTEGFEAIPALCALVGGLVAASLEAAPLVYGVCTMAGKLIGGLGNATAINSRFSPLVKIATWVSYVNGFGLMTFLLAGLGYFNGGWACVIFYAGGAVIAEVLLGLLDTVLSRSIYKETGVLMTTSERNFLSSFMYHARRVGADPDLRLEDHETEVSKWMPAYMELARRWPTVVARFSLSDD